MKKIIIIILSVLAGGFWAGTARAAVIYFDPAEGSYGLGDEFAVDVKLDVNQYCINTVEATIDFTPGVRLMDFSAGNSFLNVWLDRPATADMDGISAAGRLYIAGGIPGGYCGPIPGDPGVSNIIGTLVFRAPTFTVSETDLSQISLKFGEPTRALINDGAGTADELLKKEAVFALGQPGLTPKKDWSAIKAADRIPPEPFVIELNRQSDMFDGRYYLIFSTTDKQSGIDHYEVIELRPGEEAGVAPKRSWLDFFTRRSRLAPAWQPGAMPYLLSDQELLSTIKVKAVDKAGNERIVEYVPPSFVSGGEKPSFWPYAAAVAGAALVLVLFVIIIIKFIRQRNAIKK